MSGKLTKKSKFQLNNAVCYDFWARPFIAKRGTIDVSCGYNHCDLVRLMWLDSASFASTIFKNIRGIICNQVRQIHRQTQCFKQWSGWFWGPITPQQLYLSTQSPNSGAIKRKKNIEFYHFWAAYTAGLWHIILEIWYQNLWGNLFMKPEKC